MAVKYAVLGLLLERRGYGYDLMQRLEERVGPAWQLNPSTLYAALDQLEGEGMIRGRRAEQEQGTKPVRRPRRVVYEPTERGEQTFKAWVERPSVRQEPIRSELHLKLAAARREDVPALLETINHAERLLRLQYEECEEARPQGQETDDWPAAVAALMRAAALSRLDAELRWIEMARAALIKGPGRLPGTLTLTSSR